MYTELNMILAKWCEIIQYREYIALHSGMYNELRWKKKNQL